jgi:hypothetical protein
MFSLMSDVVFGHAGDVALVILADATWYDTESSNNAMCNSLISPLLLQIFVGFASQRKFGLCSTTSHHGGRIDAAASYKPFHGV